MANIITCVRIVCAVLIIFFPPLSVVFYCLYLIACLSDILDGIVARKTNTISEFGSKLDTLADFVLCVICFVKIFPLLSLRLWEYILIGAIFLIKVFNVILGIIKKKQFIVVHSIMNKIVGIMSFIIPFIIRLDLTNYYIILLLVFATFSAVQEGYFLMIAKC